VESEVTVLSSRAFVKNLWQKNAYRRGKLVLLFPALFCGLPKTGEGFLKILCALFRERWKMCRKS